MPELPEVETVCRNLSKLVPAKSKIVKWTFFRKDLRFSLPQKKLQTLIDKPLVKIFRRAKYILFEFENEIMISHLGMTGSWRQEDITWRKRKHDHLAFQLQNGKVMVYEDPRRFGFIELIEKSDLKKRFKEVGVEPLEKETDFDLLSLKFKNMSTPIKNNLMNQKLVVGIGNIYASEILFAAGVNPLKKSSSLSLDQYKKIWKETKRILNQAILSGGSTIENYKNSFGEKGRYQSKFLAYGRESEMCTQCKKSKIKQKTMAGRSTFWCEVCQK